MTPLLQGGLPTPLLARMHACISAARFLRFTSVLHSSQLTMPIYNSAPLARYHVLGREYKPQTLLLQWAACRLLRTCCGGG